MSVRQVVNRMFDNLDGVAKPDLVGAVHEVEPLLGVSRDAVEQGSQCPTRCHPHVLGRLIAEELQLDDLTATR